MKYIPVLDFLDEHPPITPYKFIVGSARGDIPLEGHVKTTHQGVTILDGLVESLKKLHTKGKSYGGKFDPSDLLVSFENPLHVTINKVATMKASRANIHKDFLKLVNSVVMTRYVELAKKPGGAEKRPAYLDDFISRVEELNPESGVDNATWNNQLWIIWNHPLLIEPGKRRLLLEDYYKFYKSLDSTAAEDLVDKIDTQLYNRWQVLIAPKDAILTAAYWKKRPGKRPRDYRTRNYWAHPDHNEEKFKYYPYTSKGGYLALFLRNFIVHGPEEALAWGISLEELELIVAYYFGNFLPLFLEEMTKARNQHMMPNEILDVYELRRSVSFGAPGL